MFRQPSRPASILVAIALMTGAAAPAFAQEVMPTAKDADLGGAPPPPPPGPIDMPGPARDGARNLVRAVGPCGGRVDPATGKFDQSPHGEVYAGAGTKGYREAGGVVCVPLGDHVAATVAVDVGRYPAYGWRP